MYTNFFEVYLHLMRLQHAAEEAIAEERNQRKRRGRVGDAPAERKGGAADSTVTAALNRTQEQADVLDDGVENGRSKGEMLMECVVKVSLP